MKAGGRVVLLLALVGALGYWAALQLELDYRLDRFLPQPTSAEQALVSDQVSRGPGSRLIFAALTGADSDTLAATSRDLAAAWQRLDEVERVDNGASELDRRTRERLLQARFVLIDNIPERVRPEAIAAALDRRRGELAMAGDRIASLVRSDPLGLLQDLGARLGAGQPAERHDGLWFDRDGQRALLVLHAAPAPFDGARQQALLGGLHAIARQQAANVELELAGVPVITAHSAEQSRADARRLSLLAAAFVVAILLMAWHSPVLVAAGALPLAAGVVCGLLLTALGFDRVHGLTLAFGGTLLGVALDYPLHLFGHGRHAHVAAHTIGRPLMLGVVSTLIAYLAIWQSTSPGLAQLGAFSAAGLLTAAAVTLLVLPRLGLNPPARPRPLPRLLPRWHWLPPLLALIAAGVFFLGDTTRWSSDLSRLSPVNPDRVAADRELRRATGGGDVGWLLVHWAAEREAVLEATAETVSLLDGAAAAGLLDHWQAVTELLPPRATQQRRLAAWPAADELRERLQRTGGFRDDAFEPFLADLEAARRAGPVTAAFWDDTPLAGQIDSLLSADGDGWRSLIVPSGVDDGAALERWLAEHDPAVSLVDLRAVSERMVADYRREVGISLALAVLIIVALLIWRLGGLRPAFAVLVPVASAVACTGAVLARLDEGLTIVHLVGLLLAGGIGLDFALFSHALSASRHQAGLARRSVALCAISSGGVFLILGSSHIGLLRMLGQTVALGILLSLLFAWMSQPRARSN